jgi:flavodoxin
MKKCLIVYYSYHHKNTEKIANAMAEISNAKLCTIEELGAVNMDEYEIIGFGSGIAYSKHYDKLLNAVGQLNLRGKTVFVFSTSGQGKDSSNSALIELLKRADASVAGSFACRGYDTFGPFKLIGGLSKGHPDSDDIANAKQFMKRIAS